MDLTAREVEATGGGITRRALVVAAGGGAVGLSALDAEGRPSIDVERLRPIGELYDPRLDALWATVERVFGERTLLVMGHPPGKTEVHAIAVGLIERAIIDRAGPVKLSDFVAGDEVMIGGLWRSQGFQALVLEQAYRRIEARVKRAGRRRLTTSQGPIRFGTDTRVLPTAKTAERRTRTGEALTRLRPGDRIWGTGRWDGASAELRAVTVATAGAKR